MFGLKNQIEYISDSFSVHSWAVSTVMTRQNAIPLGNNNNNNVGKTNAEESTKLNGETVKEEITQLPALVPFWDLANHMNGIVTTSYNLTSEQIEGATLSDVKKGEQIFIHYGNRNNANLLVHNGLVDL